MAKMVPQNSRASSVDLHLHALLVLTDHEVMIETPPFPTIVSNWQRVTLGRRRKSYRERAKVGKAGPAAHGLLLANTIRDLESEDHAPCRRSKLCVDAGAGTNLETHERAVVVIMCKLGRQKGLERCCVLAECIFECGFTE